MLGRIRGENAAAATVLRVSSLPPAATEAAPVFAEATSHFDANEQLTESFYAVLSELHAQARAWEEKAPAPEQASPSTIAALWKKALDACEARGEPAKDAFGRRLRLSQLPPDLLALTNPRQVIVTGTRLPEDVENWSAWVAREIP